ncbi:oxidoreductase [Macroventuria anomochaeta]|uniref:Oxidoreductase n=1 Tax=Macroventuria anomochaeta TaxID=301207 RepID=A0ACB6RKS1_9PLEO|nr:oxidoreductase [Macroventuria anomochaeta]KAF2622530.1 oxidoreductase [Macroventuria anomochaeta]
MSAQSASPTKTYHKAPYPSIDPTRPELSAKGKIVVVTGGGTGIGAETARYFARAGALRIAILGRHKQPLLDTKATIGADNPFTEVLAIPTDITNIDSVEAAFSHVARNSKIDILVSNAAVIGTKAPIISQISSSLLSGIIINIQGNFNVATAFLKHAAVGGGVIIEVNSAAAHLTIAPEFAAYNIAKVATARFYSSLAFEHPELAVFSIQPGAIETEMNKNAGYKEKNEGEEWEWAEGGGAADILSQYDDVGLPAAFMVWLASPEARFLKGKYLWANWDVDELKARRKEIEGTKLLELGLTGWPFQ